MKDTDNIKIKVQRRIVFFSVILLIAKVTAYQMTYSVGILTDALESIVNVVAGLISLYGISKAVKPKDANHPFGHGKIEFIAASLEGLLISLAGIWIIYEAFARLFFPVELQKLDIGIIIIAAAGLINFILGSYSIKIGEKHKSIALIAGGKHLKSDTYSSIGLTIGLIVLYFTGIMWLDSLIAMCFGSIIIFAGVNILKTTIANLTDETDFHILGKIADILNSYKMDNIVDINNLRIIKHGEDRHIDCNITLPWYFNVRQIENENVKISKLFNDNFEEVIDLAIHPEPCSSKHCKSCYKSNCNVRIYDYESKPKYTIESLSKVKH